MFTDLRIRRGIQRGEFFFGCFSNMASVVPVHLAAQIGYDFIVLDHEHSPASLESVVHCVNAAQGSGAEIWVRVPALDQSYIKRVLDCGATGIMCPMVATAEDARRLVSYCTFPPAGTRGVAPGLCRHTDYGLTVADYMSRIAANVTIMPQIETREALRNIDEIVRVEGITLFFVGPFDLSADLGCMGKFDHPDLTAAVGRIEAAVKNAGKALATFLLPGQDAAALRARGYSVILAGSDVSMLRGALAAQHEQLSKARKS